MGKCLASLAVRKCQHQSEWLLSRKQKTTNIGEENKGKETFIYY
jgi:hypothetical protein